MAEIKDFAFASGGAVWRAIDRSKFETSLRRKVPLVIGLVLLCWLPLAALSLYKLGWQQFYLHFLRDVATHVRFLLVLPILLFARNSINVSFNKMIHFFHETRIIDQDNKEQFDKILSLLIKWSNSKFVDLFILVIVYFGFYVQQTGAVESAGVYAPWHLYEQKLTPAGWWYVLFSLPILQMLLFRWLFTIILWIIFLRKISRINLHLSALHPDGMGGLGFLQYTQISFFPVALAFSSLIAGVLNNSIIFAHASIVDYKVLIGAVLVFVLMLFILPLLQFLPLLSAVKKKYFFQYSMEAWPIARTYEKELKTFYSTGEEKPDASWHIDLVGSFEKVKDMQIILVDKISLLSFTAAVILPFLPVAAQQLPLKQILFDLVGKILG